MSSMYDFFELKQEHLDLLNAAWISWDDCEFGAPCIDCKRPYGNSDVLGDIAEILKIQQTPDMWDARHEEWTEKAHEYFTELHKETQIALQVILHAKSFKPGKYKREKYTMDWERVEE